MRTPLKMDVIRDRGAMGREVEDGMIENVYRLQVMNTSERAHTFRIGVSGIDSIRLVTPAEVRIEGASTRAVPVLVRIDHATGKPGSNPIAFALQALDEPGLRVDEKAVFIVPK
jgi:polyferredoxin